MFNGYCLTGFLIHYVEGKKETFTETLDSNILFSLNRKHRLNWRCSDYSVSHFYVMFQVYNRGDVIFHVVTLFYDSWWWCFKTIQGWQISLSLSIPVYLSMTSLTTDFLMLNDKKYFQVINVRVLKEVTGNSCYRRYSEWYIVLTFIYMYVYFKHIIRMKYSYFGHIEGVGTL